jgi:hypothetical protein
MRHCTERKLIADQERSGQRVVAEMLVEPDKE